MRLQPGDTAPELTLKNSDGEAVKLSRFWQQQPVVLNFLRHFG